MGRAQAQLRILVSCRKNEYGGGVKGNFIFIRLHFILCYCNLQEIPIWSSSLFLTHSSENPYNFLVDKSNGRIFCYNVWSFVLK